LESITDPMIRLRQSPGTARSIFATGSTVGGLPLHAIRASLAHAGAKLADFGWQQPSATLAADLRNYLTGAHPMGSRRLRAQTIGRIQEYQKMENGSSSDSSGHRGTASRESTTITALSAYPVSVPGGSLNLAWQRTRAQWDA
jgi:hypothetical protein